MADDRRRADFDAIKRMPFEEIAAGWGYVRDGRASSRTSPVLRAPALPKLVTRQCDNGHWVYFNTLDADDNGTAIDFLLRRGLSFADIGARFGRPVAGDFHCRWRQARPEPAPQWLVGRGIRRETLACRPIMRCDRDGRVLFAHRDRHRRLTGFEIGPPDEALRHRRAAQPVCRSCRHRRQSTGPCHHRGHSGPGANHAAMRLACVRSRRRQGVVRPGLQGPR